MTKTSKWPLENSKKKVCPAYMRVCRTGECQQQRHISYSFHVFNSFFMPRMMYDTPVSSVFPFTQNAYLTEVHHLRRLLQPFIDVIVQYMTLLEITERTTSNTAN